MQNWQQVCAEMNHAEEWHRAAMQSAELGGAVIGRLFCELQVLRLEVKRLEAGHPSRSAALDLRRKAARGWAHLVLTEDVITNKQNV